MSPQLLTGAVFCTVYLYIVLSRRYIAAALWIGVAVLVVIPPILGQSPIVGLKDLFSTNERGWEAINWNVIGIFAGTLLLAEVFIYSRVPAVLSDWLIDRAPNMCWAILGVCAISSVISVFAENVATVLIVAPVAIELAKKLKVSPAPFLIGIAIASNLQGTATLIGDPPSMIFAARYGMNFLDFFWYNGRPGIFFAVQVGAVASFGVLWLMFRKLRQPIVQMEVPKPLSWFPTILMGVMVVGLAFGSLADPNFLWFGGAVCMTCAAVALLWLWRRDSRAALDVLKSYDWRTMFFLMGVFTMVFALVQSGVVAAAAKWIYGTTGESAAVAFLVIVFFSMLLSAFVDNVPFIAAMLPLVAQLEDMGVGRNMVLAYGLLIGSCLGGNITPIGASANIVAYGMLRKIGEPTSFTGFVKIGLPFTIAATGAAAIFVWIVCM